jgi:hypothetical protein
MTLQDVQDILESVFDDRAKYAGLVEMTKSRIDTEMVDVLRKVGQTSNFTPVTYDRGVLVFYTVDPFTVDQSGYSKVPLTITILSDDYDDYKEVLGLLSSEFNSVDVTLDSQGIYDKYFVEDENRPFQNYAGEYKVIIGDDFSLSCTTEYNYSCRERKSEDCTTSVIGIPPGGEEGDVLAKIDGTDYNVEWIASSSSAISLDDIQDVTIASQLNRQGLFYDSSSGLWKNKFSWIDLVTAGTMTTTTLITGGTVYTYLYSGSINRYRYVATGIDSFYSTFSGGVLSNLIIERYF